MPSACGAWERELTLRVCETMPSTVAASPEKRAKRGGGLHKLGDLSSVLLQIDRISPGVAIAPIVQGFLSRTGGFLPIRRYA